jgi:hypothetical protein
MSIANVLIRPQLLDRRPAGDEAVPLDLLTGLGSRLLADFLQGGPASRKITDASQAAAIKFITGFEPRLQTTRTKLLDWLDPYLSIIDGITGDLGNDKAKNLLAVSTSLLALVDKLLVDLHSANIAARLNSLADILENDLGVGWKTFEQFFESIFDGVYEALSNDFLHGNQGEEALNNFLISRQLLTLRRLVKGQLAAMPLPAFNRQALIREFQLSLEAGNWDETLDAIQAKLKKGPEQLEKILPLLLQSLSLGGNSKSLRDLPKPGQYSWYASWFRGEGTGTTDRFNLSGEAFAGEINFSDGLSVKFLENFALITAALEEAARAVKYGFDLDNGNRVSPALNLVWQSVMGVMSLLSYLVEGEEWVDFYSVKNHSAFQAGVPQALSFGASFEQFPGFWGWLWASWPHDRGNMSDGMTWPKLIREGLLSLFTLINANDNPNTKNHQKINGITAATRTGGSYIASLIMGRKERYYSIFSDSFGTSVLVILGGGAITWAFDIIGWLISGAFARRLSDRYWKFESNDFTGGVGEFFGGENAYGSLFGSFKEFYDNWGSFWEEKTDNGKFGLKAKILTDGTLENGETTFKGYPEKESSPYRLPFEPGRLVFCPQAHNGFSGHNYRKGLIYAVDFLLNEGELALAMREGTVVEFHDDRPNGSDLGPNYIIIRHDTLDAVHDRGENGEVTGTYARYEHASPYGIRQAFATMGISESQILYTKVRQGFPLIRVGKRPGFFNFDYLQVQVGGAAKDGLLPTIPFVFHDLPDDGVPHKGKYVGSGNTTRIPADLSQYHPGISTGWVLDSGMDFIILQPTAIDLKSAYIGSHFIVWYNLNGSEPWYEYQKVKSYDNDKRKLTIAGNWLAGHPPPPQSQYRIGAPAFEKAGTFDKHFAYLAKRNSGGQAIPFPDGHAVYTLLKTSNYQTPSVTGTIVGGGLAGSSEAQLSADASGVDHEYNFRHIIIRRAGEMIQYRRILDFRIEAGVRKVIIEGAWDMDLLTAVTPDVYEIGVPAIWQIPSLITKGFFVPFGDTYLSAGPNPSPLTKAFFVPDQPPELYSPDKFSDNSKPTRYVMGPHLEV